MALVVGLKNFTGRIGSALTGNPKKPAGIEWLVTMEDGNPLQGWVSTSVHDKERKGLAKLRMGGRMIITYRSDFDPIPQRLLSRKEPIFEGLVANWPPSGSQLRLMNGPIEYFKADEVYNAGAEPVITIISNSISFSDQAVSLLAIRPTILEAIVVSGTGVPWKSGRIGGARITWNDTRSLVSAEDPPVKFYHIYRRFDGDAVNGWTLAGIVPSTTQQYVDVYYRGDRACEYIVLHAAQYPFDYHYESLVGTPVRVNTLAEIEQEKNG
jgi:hypothetical protein